jgi:hypothetical protein
MHAALSLQHPFRAPHDGPVPLRLQLEADPELHRALDGALDQALDIVLVRRDRPGVRFVTTFDPRALDVAIPPMAPDAPPQPTPGAVSPGVFREDHAFDLHDHGATHPGSAEYYVFAAFATAYTDPRPMRIEHPRRVLPALSFHELPSAEESSDTAVMPPSTPAVMASFRLDGLGPRVVGAFRCRARAAHGSVPEAPFVTVVVIHQRPRGGVSAATFIAPRYLLGSDHIGTFSIPLDAVLPEARPGPCRILVFCADELSAPIDAVLP